MKLNLLICQLVFLFFSSSLFAGQPSFDTQKIAAITGVTGVSSDDGVYKLSIPRVDVPISVDGWSSFPPFMGVTSWVSFAKGRQNEVMLMGDLVLFQDEVNPVMDVILDGKMEVTALHNHFFYDQPKVYFMHISGEGDVEKTATAIKAIFEKIKEIRGKAKDPQTTFGLPEMPSKSQLSQDPLEKIFGQKGVIQEGMVKFVFGRTATMSCLCKVGKNMGVQTWAAFGGQDDHAVVAGDFALLGEEIQDVLKILRQGNLNVVAIHHHMVGEAPKYYFVHFWGVGKAAGVAGVLRDALGKTKGP